MNTQFPGEKSPTAFGQKRGEGGELRGTVKDIKPNGYGFLMAEDGSKVFFHVTGFIDRSQWDKLRVGTRVSFEYGIAHLEGKPRAARKVALLKGDA